MTKFQINYLSNNKSLSPLNVCGLRHQAVLSICGHTFQCAFVLKITKSLELRHYADNTLWKNLKDLSRSKVWSSYQWTVAKNCYVIFIWFEDIPRNLLEESVLGGIVEVWPQLRTNSLLMWTLHSSKQNRNCKYLLLTLTAKLNIKKPLVYQTFISEKSPFFRPCEASFFPLLNNITAFFTKYKSTVSLSKINQWKQSLLYTLRGLFFPSVESLVVF